MKIYLKEILDKYPEFECSNYKEGLFFENFNHDSRVRVENALFIPIIGENFNGHEFINFAFENGAVISLLQKDQLIETLVYKGPLILVDNIEESLEKIVAYVREKIEIPIIAITGSTGKTMTREMVSSILSTKGTTLKSDRNYNTLWGNAEILSKYTDQDYVVLEIGMDRKGEIQSQCKAFMPDIGIILNVGYVHALSLGGIENIYLEKKELANYLLSNSRPVCINIDDPRLVQIQSDNKNIITFGFHKDAKYRIKDVQLNEEGTLFEFSYENKKYKGNIKMLGKGYVYNAVSAIALCHKLGFTIEECIEGLKQCKVFHGRFEIIKTSKGTTLINDAYNANPTSVEMSLETFDEIWKRTEVYKILVLGDMKELGEVSKIKHQEIGLKVKSMKVEQVYYIGEYFQDFNLGIYCENLDEVYENVKLEIEKHPQSIILFKASNSIGLEQVIEKLILPI